VPFLVLGSLLTVAPRFAAEAHGSLLNSGIGSPFIGLSLGPSRLALELPVSSYEAAIISSRLKQLEHLSHESMFRRAQRRQSLRPAE
jgi:hypothetical protein